jgi:hypothetical protein
MGGFYSHPFFANLYEIFKNFSYYIYKANDLPSGRKEKKRCWADRFSMPTFALCGGFKRLKPPFFYPPKE